MFCFLFFNKQWQHKDNFKSYLCLRLKDIGVFKFKFRHSVISLQKTFLTPWSHLNFFNAVFQFTIFFDNQKTGKEVKNLSSNSKTNSIVSYKWYLTIILKSYLLACQVTLALNVKPCTMRHCWRLSLNNNVNIFSSALTFGITLPFLVLHKA